MKVGLQLPEVEREVRWPEIEQMALLAEDVGFESLWVGDHLLYRPDGVAEGPWEAWSLLAALAAVTKRVKIGPLVAATSFHNPAMIAKKAATVDEISDGRLVLGLGAGWNEIEYRAFGFPFDHRVSRFEEAFHIIRLLLREGEASFSGQFYQVEECALRPFGSRPDIPLMLGSKGPRMLSIALPHVDLWNAWYAWFDNDPDRLGPLLGRVDQACHLADRDPDDVKKTAAVLVATPHGGGRSTGQGFKGPAPISGSVAGVAAGLRRFEAVGIDELQLVVDPITIPSVEWLAQVLAELGSWESAE